MALGQERKRLDRRCDRLSERRLAGGVRPGPEKYPIRSIQSKPHILANSHPSPITPPGISSFQPAGAIIVTFANTPLSEAENPDRPRVALVVGFGPTAAIVIDE